MKPFLLCCILAFAAVCNGQDQNKLIIRFQNDSHELTSAWCDSITHFIGASDANAQFEIYAFASESGDSTYNNHLSYRREMAAMKYLSSLNLDTSQIRHSHLGENYPICLEHTSKCKAMNRRVELRRHFITTTIEPEVIKDEVLITKPKNSPNPKKVNSNPPVTKEVVQQNGIRIKYVEGRTPREFIDALGDGNGNAFGLIETITQQSEQNMQTITEDGTLLSSLCIICPPPCKSCLFDTTYVVYVPIHNPNHCDLSQVKFYNEVVQAGARRWKESKNKINAEYIDGVQYIVVELNTASECINFDYEIKPPCFEIENVVVEFPQTESIDLTSVCPKYNAVWPVKVIDQHKIEMPVATKAKKTAYLKGKGVYENRDFKITALRLKKLRYSKKKNTYIVSRHKMKKYRE